MSKFVVAAVLLSLTVACSPKDMKVSSRGGTAVGPAGVTDSSFSDRSPEYTRAMLIELAEAARELEKTFEQIQNSASAMKAPACEVVKKIESVSANEIAEKNSVLKFETSFVGCVEDGVTFNGTLNGKKETFATLSSEKFPMAVRVTSLGIENILKPKANSKDTLRVTGHATFSADFLAIEEKTLVYRFKRENRSHYALDLKSFTDAGKIISSVSGLLTYDLESKKVTGFTATETSDRMLLKVESAREGRSGGRVVRQEFFGSVDAESLALDLTSCSLPQGLLNSRFTVAPIGGDDKKYVIDSRNVFESRADHMYKLEKSLGPDGETELKRGPRTEAKLCSNDSLTFTEFFSGILY